MGFRCNDCPIRGTKYCHKVNPRAKKYTWSEKVALREALDKEKMNFSNSHLLTSTL